MADQPPDANVAQQENNGFGPLFKPRGRAAVIVSIVVLIMSGVVLVFSMRERESKEGIHFLVFSAALLTLSAVFGELLRRVCLVTEEAQHKGTRYQGNWKHVFSSTFAFEYGRSILVVTVGSALFVCYALYEHYKVFSHPNYAIMFAVNCFLVPQLVFLVGLRELSTVETSEINERENKNLADGLAWGYYFGYLKLVLPELKKQIGQSDEFRYKITKKKLFILLPKTCFTYDDIEKADDRVKYAGNLPECKINRGGIKARSYKHTVHRIEMPRPDGGVDEYHFVLEYATPLMNLFDMSEHASLSRQERDHQVVLFMRKLKDILDHSPECKGKYELVPISGTETNKIADVLVEMYNAAKIELDEHVDAN
ncbi:stimulator of interferon genes protein-like isoform X3 [Orbicella faveolata]|uniref:stimulator of interferon genes protein-like isoform X3 n=1 Tax=Orbicella faveolata TaxID=48498 RepID=UPI0009E2ED73|nr:stimulator of interferon genes protein-like isoform X3 [Orbicella faveolata]